MELRCAVFGKADVFPVQIARDVTVRALQEAISDVLSTEQQRVPPRSFEVYLARKDGVWLIECRSAESLLRPDIDTGYTKMCSSWKLDREELFGENFQPDAKQIHVLVDLSPQQDGATSETSQEDKVGKQVGELRELVLPTKRKRQYLLSEMNLIKGRELLQELNIRTLPEGSVPFDTGDPPPVEAFVWDSARDEHGQIVEVTEEQQRERYRKYMKDNIGDVLASERLCVLSLERESNLLSAIVPDHDVEFVGGTDMLILNYLAKKHPNNLDLLPEVRMLIEVKREMNQDAVFQTLSELIALDVLVPDPVMALLTDMTGHWQFFWVSESGSTRVIIRTVVITEASAAFAVIRTLLAQSPSSEDTEISLPCFKNPVKRRKLVTELALFSEDGGGGDGIREALEQYHAIASELGPDVDMARAVARKIIESISIFGNRPPGYFD